MKRIAQAYTKKPKHLQPLISYIASRQENDLIDFLEKKKIDTGVSTQDLVKAATFYVAKEQKKGNFQKAIKELYNLHPDKWTILELFATQENFEGKEEKANKKTDFFKSPLFRVLVVILSLLVLIVVISKIGD